MTRFFYKIYFALSGLKKNVKSLSDSTDVFEKDTYVAVKTHITDLEQLLQTISQLFNNGFDKDDIHYVMDVTANLSLNESQRLNYNVYFNDELVGLTLLVILEELQKPTIYFVTEETLAHELQMLIEMHVKASFPIQ